MPGSQRQLVVVGLSRRHWQTTDPVRDVFRPGFAAAGQSYYSPHSFRRTLTRLGQQVCTTPEELKAWSQNLGHEDVSTTLHSYGTVSGYRQAEIIGTLAEKPRSFEGLADGELRARLARLLAEDSALLDV
jgi:hypothetical protein